VAVLTLNRTLVGPERQSGRRGKDEAPVPTGNGTLDLLANSLLSIPSILSLRCRLS
jgi:hypothetical protein